MVEIVVLSGKGGTGKTTVSAAFAHLAEHPVICDLDVDAPDLHLLLQPRHRFREAFISGNVAVIDDNRCDGCGLCRELCRFDAVKGPAGRFVVDPLKCEGCRLCVAMCPAGAIDFPEKHCGDWYLSDTRFGTMIHAQLLPGEENSGRLVALLRQKAREIAAQKDRPLILADGPPGIGCPVISSLSGTGLAVLVTEPTPSGIHDLKRVAELCAHFSLPAGVIVNKFDLHLDQSRQIASYCEENGLHFIGTLPHDPVAVSAMVNGVAVTEFSKTGLADDLRQVWEKVVELANVQAVSLEMGH